MTRASLKEMAMLTARTVHWQNYKCLTYKNLQKYSDFGPSHDSYQCNSTHSTGTFQFQKKFLLRLLHFSLSLLHSCIFHIMATNSDNSLQVFNYLTFSFQNKNYILARVKGAEIYEYKAVPSKYLLLTEGIFSWWTMVRLGIHLILAFPWPDVLDFLTEAHWLIRSLRWWHYRKMQSNYCFWTPLLSFWLWTGRLKDSPC